MGLIGMARGLASEFAPHNFRVNVVSPGSIDTRRNNPEWYQGHLPNAAGVPLGRQGSVDEIAATCLFAEIAELASLNLALVGLAGFEDYFPAQISGGMQKRAGLARAMALSPEVLLFDEPSAGLDPISSRLLDDLILELRDSLGATIVMVTHELASIFTVGDNSVFLDPETKTQIASGAPKRLLAECPDPKVQRFLRRGETGHPGPTAANQGVLA